VRIAVDILLGLGVLAAWVAALAYPRLATSFDRLHVVAFVNVATGGAIALAALLEDGLSARALKSLLAWLIMVGFGALLAHAVSRALYFRGGKGR
jgi:multisubunit Na+/H+ antiporter MnhG subunit